MTFFELLGKRLLVVAPMAFIFGLLKAINHWPDWTTVAAGIVLALVAHFIFPEPPLDGQGPTGLKKS